jgi:hypothetical protein
MHLNPFSTIHSTATLNHEAAQFSRENCVVSCGEKFYSLSVLRLLKDPVRNASLHEIIEEENQRQ